MTPQQIVGLAVRLFSIWMLTLVIKTIGQGMALNEMSGLRPNNVSFVIAAILFVLALVLWFFPMTIAHKLIPNTQYDNVINLAARDVVVASCIVMGLGLFVVVVLPSLSYYLPLAFAATYSGTPIQNLDEFHIRNIGPILLNLIVSGILCFKAHAISRFFLMKRLVQTHDGRMD